MKKTLQEIDKFFEGDIEFSTEAREKYSRDTSIFKVRPEAVLHPKHSIDIRRLVSFVTKQKEAGQDISITARSGGTDMTGGPLTTSLVLDFSRYFDEIKNIDEDKLSATLEPGVYYRDFEKETLPEHISLPTYPASKNIAAIGGMVANNAGGERTLRFGKTADYVETLKVVLQDGYEYELRKLNKDQLEEKKSLSTFEGAIYRKMHDLIEDNKELIESSRPQVSKNSAGYALWDVWDGEYFDLTRLICGSQGTLGIITETTFRLVREKSEKRLIVLFMSSWQEMAQAVTTLLPFDPDSLEVFDKETLKLGLRFMPEIAEINGESFWRFARRFLPEVKIGIKMLGLPPLVMLVELAEDTEAELDKKTAEIKRELDDSRSIYRVLRDEAEAEKYWVMRRESFNLLRQHVKGKRTVAFVEDFCIKPERAPEFLPKAKELLERNGIDINIAGHAGNGNFHIIPLMDISQQSVREKIPRVEKEFNKLVIEHGGTITAEHNDGILRTPFLEDMFGEEMYDLFKEVKHIFDPHNIFNPGKKVGGSLEFYKEHMLKEL